MTTPLIRSVSLQLVTALACTPAYSADPVHDHPDLRATLVQRYPGTVFGDIRPTPLPGIFQVQLGAQPAYVAADGRYFLFGHLVDMETQTDLSPPAEPPTPPGEALFAFADLPLADAIPIVRGKGTRKMAVFADPECPYCRALETELDQVDDVTVYTFLLPLKVLHPDADRLAQTIWCADDRAAAWRRVMRSERIGAGTCPNPLRRIAQFATAHGVDGTPYLVFENGRHAVGALNHAVIDSYLNFTKE